MKISKKSSVISRSAAILLMIGFFMPWATIACQDVGGWGRVTRFFDNMRGVTRCVEDTATGLERAIDQEQGNVLYFVIPVVGLVTLLASFLPLKIARLIYVVSAIVGLGMVIYLYFQNYIAQVQVGWWLSLIAFLAIFVAGYLTKPDEAKKATELREILERNKQKASPRIMK